MRIRRITNRPYPMYRRFYKGLGFYFTLSYRPNGIELRWDSQSCQLEAWREHTPNDTHWYFVIRWERNRRNWKLGFESYPHGIKLYLGPLALLIPLNQALEPMPDY